MSMVITAVDNESDEACGRKAPVCEACGEDSEWDDYFEIRFAKPNQSVSKVVTLCAVCLGELGALIEQD